MTAILGLTALFLSGLYIRFCCFVIDAWSKQASDPMPSLLSANQPLCISIVIAARNEQGNIRSCLDSILANDYPSDRYEIIVVDDYSEDLTPVLVEGYNEANIRLLRLSECNQFQFRSGHKKGALAAGASQAQYPYLLFTDADCIVGPQWIQSMTGMMIKKRVHVVAGPVRFRPIRSWLDRFQLLEMAGNQIGTQAGIMSRKYYSANGANLCTIRHIYLEYLSEASFERASGDDVFYVQWAARNGYEIRYSKSRRSVVCTFPEKGWAQFIQQRIRWAGKTLDYRDKGLMVLMGALYLFHVVLVITALGGLLMPGLWWWFLLLMSVKLMADYRIVRLISQFQGVPMRWIEYPLMVFMHAIYLVIIGSIGLWRPAYVWKGREVR